MRRLWFGILAISLASLTLRAADDDYRTVDTAITAKVQPAATPAKAVVPGFLGVHVQPNSKGQPVVGDVQPESPGEKAGLKVGDLLSRFDGKDVATVDAFRTALRAKAAGDSIKLGVIRDDKAVELSAKLTPVSRPMPPGRSGPGPLGVQVSPAKEGEGVTIESVQPGSLAERRNSRSARRSSRSTRPPSPTRRSSAKSSPSKKPDDTVTLTLLLAEKQVEMKVKLEADRPMGGRRRRTGRRRVGPQPATGPSRSTSSRIILVEYPDVKHNPKITPKAWEESMFSHGTYKKIAPPARHATAACTTTTSSSRTASSRSRARRSTTSR